MPTATPMITRSSLLNLLAAGLAAGLTPLDAAQQQFTGADGNWFNQANWSPFGSTVPTAADFPIIAATTATIASPGAVARELYIGPDDYYGAYSKVIVTGSGTLTTNGGIGLWIGYHIGSGHLEVRDGGTVTNAGITRVGEQALGFPTNSSILVTGANSRLTSGTIQLGLDPLTSGMLVVADGGFVSAPSVGMSHATNSSGAIELHGTATGRGVLQTNFLTQGFARVGLLVFNGGILRAGTNQQNFLQNFDSGDVDLRAGGGFIDTQAFAIGISTPISGVGSLTKQGTGTLTLSGANTYAGTTILSAGTLALGSASAIGGGGTISFEGGTLQLSAANTTDYSSRFSTEAGQSYRLDTGGQSVALATPLTSSGGSLTKLGEGTLTLTAANTYTGGTIVAAGTLTSPDSTTLPSGSAVTVELGATLNFPSTGGTRNIASLAGAGSVTTVDGTLSVGGSGASSTFSGVISGGTALTKVGPGTLTLSGTNTYTGLTTISNGTIALGAAHALSDSSAINVVNGAILNLANFSDAVSSLGGSGNVTLGSGTLSVGVNNASSDFSGIISGTGGLTKIGTGTLRLFLASTYTGPTTVSAGTLTAFAANNISSASAILVEAGAILSFPGTVGTRNIASLAGAGNLTTVGGALSVGGSGASSEFSGVISGGNVLTKVGTGTLTLSGANTYTGVTNLNAGTLELAANENLGAAAGAVTFGGGTLRATGDFTAARTTTLNSGGGTFEVNNGATLQWDGNISGASGHPFTKLGAGTLLLGGNNTYFGDTTISAGKIQLGSSTALPAAGALKLAGGTLATGGLTPGATLGPLMLIASSTIDFGSGTSALGFADSSAIGWAGTLSILNYTTGTDSLKFGSSPSALTSTQLAAINFGTGLTAQIDASGFVTGVSVIPEPGTYALLAGVLAVAASLIRKRRRAAP
jgi:fibronectin-binding autotransporter adhesin